MQTIELESLRFPIGRFKAPETFTDNDISTWIHRIDNLPAALGKEVIGLTDRQLDTPYREEGWTVRQVVHHLVDSHVNSYCRFKLAMTEEIPEIRPYHEDRWAKLEDGLHAPVEMSLSLLSSLHTRWVYFLRTFKAEDWKRKLYHPEAKREYELFSLLALYAWHGDHHLAHITSLKKRFEW